MIMTDSKDSAARRTGRIKDARGRVIAPLDVISLHLLRQYDIIEAEPLHAIVREKDFRITNAERMFLIVGIVAILAVGSLFIYSVIVGDFGGAPYAKSSALAYFSAMPWLAWFIIRRARFHKLRRRC
jgi:hypothetical protein